MEPGPSSGPTGTTRASELTAASGGPQGGVTYAYDADGNQITAGNTHATYDLDNKVVSVDDGTNRTAFTQDAAGNRVAADTRPGKGGTTTHTSYRWDVNNDVPMLAAEQTGTAPVRNYIYGPERAATDTDHRRRELSLPARSVRQHRGPHRPGRYGPAAEHDDRSLRWLHPDHTGWFRYPGSAAVADPARGFDAIVVGEYERAFAGGQLLEFAAAGGPVRVQV